MLGPEAIRRFGIVFQVFFGEHRAGLSLPIWLSNSVSWTELMELTVASRRRCLSR